MSTNPFIGDIAVYPYNFTPANWHSCDGSLLPIAQNSALFALIGCTYGGDCRTNFAVPDLRGRTPIGVGHGNGLSLVALGMRGGLEQQTAATLPSHTHTATLHGEKKPATSSNLQDRLLAGSNVYADPDPQDNKTFASDSIIFTENNGPASVDNRGPWLGISYCIALQGIFPSRN